MLAEVRSLGRLGVRGYFILETFENIGENLVHFGDIRSSKVVRKIDAFPFHLKSGTFHPTFKTGVEFTVPAV